MMNGGARKSKLYSNVELTALKEQEKIELLQKENQELLYEINNIRTSLDINKNALLQVISASTKDQQISALVIAINSLAKENMSLQNEVQRVQDEYIKAIRVSYVECLMELNSK